MRRQELQNAFEYETLPQTAHSDSIVRIVNTCPHPTGHAFLAQHRDACDAGGAKAQMILSCTVFLSNLHAHVLDLCCSRAGTDTEASFK
jgi:hypothetical protein